MKPTAIEKPGERNWDGKLGIHGKKCPHCFDGDCECCCEECRPDMWEDKKSDDLKPTVGWEDRFDECNIWQKWGDEIVTKEIKSFISSLLQAKDAEIEQLRVQLAGCGVAALGGQEVAKKGDYGWSASYQDVLKLRKKFEAKDAEWTIRCEKAIKENVERNIRAEGKRKDAKFKRVLEGLKMEKKVYLILATERDLPHFNQAVDLINSKISKAIKEIERKTR